MAKVFTITQGLENMGAMKTGGQGSVYKGRRIGEIITAIKLLPTPIYSESVEDKNYRDFLNEVQKLKEVNKVPNPNVVKILSSGLTETGNFPFIEMEYIDGPDLEELLSPPQDPIFTIKEVIKVAEQLSFALAHCHRHDVKHGDIKSNNIKLNLNTGNYVLLDFGLAIMNDEQRRTSLRKAGAVEFMAPEQNEGSMLFESDVYSFGVVIYELLAGKVPFPLEDKSETARNNVRLAHMETVPPDILTLRRSGLPTGWSNEKQAREMQVPDWLLTLIYTCLRKKPETRFANGIELHDFIIYHATQLVSADKLSASPAMSKANHDVEKEQLKQQLSLYRQQVVNLQREVEDLKLRTNQRESVPMAVSSGFTSEANTTANIPDGKKNNGQNWLAMALVLVLGLTMYALYALYFADKKSTTPNANDLSTPADTTAAMPDATLNTTGQAPQDDAQQKQRREDSIKAVQAARLVALRRKDSLAKLAADTVASNTNTPNDNSTPKEIKGIQFMVINKAYFYASPAESSRRNVYVEPSNSSVVNGEEEQGEFVLVTFTNTKGQPYKGWLRKKDLQQLSD